MARRKSHAPRIRAYLGEYPEASPTEIRDALRVPLQSVYDAIRRSPRRGRPPAGRGRIQAIVRDEVIEALHRECARDGIAGWDAVVESAIRAGLEMLP